MDAETLTLVEKGIAGDREAFEGLIRKFARVVYAQAFSVLRSREEAEDAAQDAFLKAFASRRRLREPERFPAWLLSIARNRALDAKRRKRPESLPEGGLPDPKAVEGETHARRMEARERVLDALSALPEPHRVAVTLRYLEGFDYERIRASLGMTNGALRGILGRSLKTLHKTLKPFAKAEGLHEENVQ
jgi:RNA polymerase sigma-70 factor (ECF subfamily)